MESAEHDHDPDQEHEQSFEEAAEEHEGQVEHEQQADVSGVVDDMQASVGSVGNMSTPQVPVVDTNTESSSSQN